MGLGFGLSFGRKKWVGDGGGGRGRGRQLGRDEREKMGRVGGFGLKEGGGRLEEGGSLPLPWSSVVELLTVVAGGDGGGQLLGQGWWSGLGEGGRIESQRSGMEMRI